jgi:hypothetical protein
MYERTRKSYDEYTVDNQICPVDTGEVMRYFGGSSTTNLVKREIPEYEEVIPIYRNRKVTRHFLEHSSSFGVMAVCAFTVITIFLS